MSWQAMMCRHVLGNSVGLFIAFGILFGMVLHLWLWRRRCAPSAAATPCSRSFISYRDDAATVSGGKYIPFRNRMTRLVHVVGGLKMKMPTVGDPVIAVPEAAFYLLMLSPSWLTADRYPPSVKLVKGEIGCLLSHDGAVRVKITDKGKDSPRTFNDRTLSLVREFMRHIGTMTKPQFKKRYEELIKEWRDLGCPDLY